MKRTTDDRKEKKVKGPTNPLKLREPNSSQSCCSLNYLCGLRFAQLIE